MQSSKTKKSKIKLIFLSVLILSSTALIKLASWWSNSSKNLILKSISISNTKVIQENELYDLVCGFIGQPLETIKIDSISKIIEDHPYVEAARISKRYPSQIKIELIEREPIAMLNIKPMVFLDKNSFVLPHAISRSNFNLPILNNFNSDLNLYPFGDKVLSKNVENCIKWLNKIKIEYPSLYGDISEMKMTSDNHMNIILSDYPTRIFLGKDQIWIKIKILKKFENELSPKKLSDFSYLDMRYENQVIAKNRSL